MSKKISVIADKFIYELGSFIGNDIALHSVESSTLLDEVTKETDALLIRTVSKIDEKCIANLPDKLRFLATASAGFDHVNRKALRKKQIHFAYAAGCNARAVAEYVITALLIWADKKQVSLSEKTLGIIGVGHVGKAVHHLAVNIGLKTVLYDPPREKRSKNFQSCSFDDLKNADILTFHTPLDVTTRHLYSSRNFSSNSYDLIINAARGGVVDESFLLNQYQTGKVKDFIIDCWENEPLINVNVAKHAFIATPHIAGYSEQAKLRATEQITKSLKRYFNLNVKAASPKHNKQMVILDSSEQLSEILLKLHTLSEYDDALRALLFQPETEHKRLFNYIRNTTTFRNEYNAIRLHKNWLIRFPLLKKLGIRSS
jgi:erythronate-4-phosphate dehydrogenase